MPLWRQEVADNDHTEKCQQRLKMRTSFVLCHCPPDETENQHRELASLKLVDHVWEFLTSTSCYAQFQPFLPLPCQASPQVVIPLVVVASVSKVYPVFRGSRHGSVDSGWYPCRNGQTRKWTFTTPKNPQNLIIFCEIFSLGIQNWASGFGAERWSAFAIWKSFSGVSSSIFPACSASSRGDDPDMSRPLGGFAHGIWGSLNLLGVLQFAFSFGIANIITFRRLFRCLAVLFTLLFCSPLCRQCFGCLFFLLRLREMLKNFEGPVQTHCGVVVAICWTFGKGWTKGQKEQTRNRTWQLILIKYLTMTTTQDNSMDNLITIIYKYKQTI